MITTTSTDDLQSTAAASINECKTNDKVINYKAEDDILLDMIIKDNLKTNNKKLNLIIDESNISICGNSKVTVQKVNDIAITTDLLANNIALLQDYLCKNKIMLSILCIQAESHLHEILTIIYDSLFTYRYCDALEINFTENLSEEILESVSTDIQKLKNFGLEIIGTCTVYNKELILTDNKLLQFIINNNLHIKFILTADNLTDIISFDNYLDEKNYYFRVTYYIPPDEVSNEYIQQLLDFIKYIYAKPKIYGTIYGTNLYKNLRLNGYTTLDCFAQQNINVYLPTLAILGCPELNSEVFTVGFITADGITSKNLPFFLMLMGDAPNNMAKCTECDIKTVCARSCLRTNFANNRDIAIPNGDFCVQHKKIIINLLD